MIETMNIAILIGAALVVAAGFTSLLSFRFGAPLLLVFLGVGLLAGQDGLGLRFNDSAGAYFIGSVALAMILFEAGYVTRFASLRLAALPALALSTVGVVATALLVGLAAQLIFHLSWTEGVLLGIIVAPTDAAAVFLLLRVGGITLRDRVRSTLEVESGSNDPMAIFLTLSLIGVAAGTVSGAEFATTLVGQLILQAGVGTVVGLAGGYLIIQAVNRTHFETALYPIVVLALALAIYAVAGLAWGSGFLAVYVAGLIAGNARIRHNVILTRFQEGTTWLAQIAMFLTLGLLATPSEFPAVALGALLLAGFLIVVARPVAVWICLLPFRFSRQEMAFVSWVGLRGAVSILLATLPVIDGLTNGRLIFNIAFVVVLASLLVQGWTIGPVARWLGLIVPSRRGPVDRIELELPGRGNHEIVAYVVDPESPVAKGQRIPRWARPSLVIRDGRTLRPHRFGRPEPGDQIYVITTPEYIGLLDRLFGPQSIANDPQLYGEFALVPETKLADVARSYEVHLPPGDQQLTIGEYLRRELAGNIEPGDRVAIGAIDLIVRRVDATHEIEEVGIAMEQSRAAPPRIPFFQTPSEIAALVRAWRAPVTPQPRVPPASAAAAVEPEEEDAPPEARP